MTVIGISARSRKRRSKRGDRCGRLVPGHNTGAGRHRCRSLDQGTTRTYIEAEAPGVDVQDPWVHGR